MNLNKNKNKPKKVLSTKGQDDASSIQHKEQAEVFNSLPGSTKHIVLPDGQVRPNTPIDHWSWAGAYCADKHPDYIHNLGDFNDMNSLSTHSNKFELEGARYKADIEYGKEAMSLFMAPIRKEQARLKKKGIHWDPKLKLYLGNHEHRILRTTEDDPRLLGTIKLEDLGYQAFGWEVHPYLRVVGSEGVAFSHYFTTGILGKPCTSSRTLVQKKHLSCIMGHVQRREVHYEYDAFGRKLTGIFAGIFYQHDEKYLGPQGNPMDRGIWVLYNVRKGTFNEQYIPIEYLKHRYK